MIARPSRRVLLSRLAVAAAVLAAAWVAVACPLAAQASNQRLAGDHRRSQDGEGQDRSKRMPRLVAAIGAGLALVVSGPAAASAQSGTVSVGDSAEAWYSTSPISTCSSPVGCPVSPPSVSGYPANTLHVGVVAAQTTAVTYVQPDLTGLPTEDIAEGGTMTLPLATVTGSGNNNISAAAIEACLATGSFSDGIEGSTDTPPPTDCSVHSRVEVGATAFTFDLAPFLAAWNAGKPEYGVALLPDPSSTGPTSNWHVAFNGRNLAGAAHISSELTLAPSTSAMLTPNTPYSDFSSGSNPAAPSAAAVPPSAAPSAVTSPQPALASPPASPAWQAATSAPAVSPPPRQAGILPAAAGGRGFQYPEVMLLPLAFAAGLVFVLRVLTSDATPNRKPF